jgi:hypothetical protein
MDLFQVHPLIAGLEVPPLVELEGEEQKEVEERDFLGLSPPCLWVEMPSQTELFPEEPDWHGLDSVPAEDQIYEGCWLAPASLC